MDGHARPSTQVLRGLVQNPTLALVIEKSFTTSEQSTQPVPSACRLCPQRQENQTMLTCHHSLHSLLRDADALFPPCRQSLTLDAAEKSGYKKVSCTDADVVCEALDPTTA